MSFIMGMIVGEMLAEEKEETKVNRPVGLPMFIELTTQNDCKRLIDLRLIHAIIEENVYEKDPDSKEKIERKKAKVILSIEFEDFYPKETYEEIKNKLKGERK